jgi:hypothetical protein
VHGGGSFIDDEVVDWLVRSRSGIADATLDRLSARELEVVSEMATGATNSVIADALGISEHAVEKRSNSIDFCVLEALQIGVKHSGAGVPRSRWRGGTGNSGSGSRGPTVSVSRTSATASGR